MAKKDSQNRYCGPCGKTTTHIWEDGAERCQECGTAKYPSQRYKNVRSERQPHTSRLEKIDGTL